MLISLASVRELSGETVSRRFQWLAGVAGPPIRPLSAVLGASAILGAIGGNGRDGPNGRAYRRRWLRSGLGRTMSDVPTGSG